MKIRDPEGILGYLGYSKQIRIPLASFYYGSGGSGIQRSDINRSAVPGLLLERLGWLNPWAHGDFSKNHTVGWKSNNPSQVETKWGSHTFFMTVSCEDHLRWETIIFLKTSTLNEWHHHNSTKKLFRSDRSLDKFLVWLVVSTLLKNMLVKLEKKSPIFGVKINNFWVATTGRGAFFRIFCCRNQTYDPNFSRNDIFDKASVEVTMSL